MVGAKMLADFQKLQCRVACGKQFEFRGKCVYKSTVALLVATVALLAQASTVSGQKPNIMLVMVDDMGWTDLGKHSLVDSNHPLAGSALDDDLSDYYETPNLSRLASQGVTFTSAYANPNCAPTRAALLTGQSGARTHLTQVNSPGTWSRVLPSSWTNILDGERTTFAEVLSDAGYNTGMIGKWHVGYHYDPSSSNLNVRNSTTGPRNQGFDVNIGAGAGGEPISFFADRDGHFRNNSGALGVHFLPDIVDSATTGRRLTANAGDYMTDVLTDKAIEYIETVKEDPAPFFSFVSYYSPHDAGGRLQAPASAIAHFNGKPVEGDRRHDNQQYAAMLYQLDQNIGRLLDHLEETDDPKSPGKKLIDTTVVMFYSDNGGDLGSPFNTTDNSPLRGGKNSQFEGGVRVPMIVRTPEMQTNGQAGTTSDQLVRDYDFLPTLAEFGGATTAGLELDGLSFRSIVSGAEPSAELDRDAIYHHWLHHGNAYSGVTSDEFDGRRYKLSHRWLRGTFDLFDISSDPYETNDLLSGVDLTNLDQQQYDALSGEQRLHVDAALSLARDLRQWLIETEANVPHLRDPDRRSVPLLDETGSPVSALFEVSQVSIPEPVSMLLVTVGVAVILTFRSR